MRDAAVLIQYIIPAIVLIFWALSNLFNREQTEAQARNSGNPLDPRLGAYPPPRPTERDRATAAAPPPRYASAPGNDEILIIRSETRPPARTNSQPRRNPGRPRPPQNPSYRRTAEAPLKQREQIGGRLATDVNQTLANTLDMRPLEQSIAATLSAATSIETQTAPVAVAEGIQPTMSAQELRANLTDPRRIRQAFLLNELLQPPVALRARSGRRI